MSQRRTWAPLRRREQGDLGGAWLPRFRLASSTGEPVSAGDRARRGCGSLLRLAFRFLGSKEDWIRAATAPARDRHRGNPADDELRGLKIVLALLLNDRGRNRVRYLVGRARSCRAEIFRRFGAERVALVANVDLGLQVCDVEMIIAPLDHSPERHVR